jgi:hypothetical protein
VPRASVAVSADGAWKSGLITIGSGPADDGHPFRMYAVVLTGATARTFARQLAAGGPTADTDLLRTLSRAGSIQPGGDIKEVASVELVRDSTAPSPIGCSS